MTKKEIEAEIAELKSDYIRIQGDLEKATSFSVNTAAGEKRLIQIEKELAEFNLKLEEMK